MKQSVNACSSEQEDRGVPCRGNHAVRGSFPELLPLRKQASAATRDSYADTVGNPTFEAARQKYGLPKDMKDGATLHAFEWSFKTIMENIPDIAKAGYTSIQTEPIVKIKDNRKLGTGNWYLNWYYVYQPTDMAIGNYVVGSEG